MTGDTCFRFRDSRTKCSEDVFPTTLDDLMDVGLHCKRVCLRQHKVFCFAQKVWM